MNPNQYHSPVMAAVSGSLTFTPSEGGTKSPSRAAVEGKNLALGEFRDGLHLPMDGEWWSTW